MVAVNILELTETEYLRFRNKNVSSIHGFRVSVPVRKIHDCYQDTQKFRAAFHSHLNCESK